MMSYTRTLGIPSSTFAPATIINEGNYSALHGPQAVDRTGATATDVQLQAAINAAAANVVTHQVSVYATATSLPITQTFYIPDGEYKLNNPLSWPQGMSIILSPGAKLKAGAAMGAMVATDKTVLHQRETWRGGILDCNNLATTGMSIGWFAHMVIDDLTVHRTALHGLVLGDTTATQTSYEAIVRNYDQWRPRDDTPPAGGYGVWARYATDGRFDIINVMGTDVGIRNDYPGNVFTHGHVWNSSSAGSGPSIAFDDNAYNTKYIDCYADSPSLYGFRLRNGPAYLTDCNITLSPSINPDNTIVGIKVDGSLIPFVVSTFRLDGGDSTHRYKTEIEGDLTTAELTGVNCTTGFVVTTIGNRARLRGLLLRNPNGGSATLVLQRQQSSSTGNFINFVDENVATMGQVTPKAEVYSTGRAEGVVTKTSGSYTMTTVDSVVLSNGAAGVNLPAASGASLAVSNVATGEVEGRRYTVRNIHASSTVTIGATSGNVDGAATVSLLAGAKLTFISDGTNWWSI